MGGSWISGLELAGTVSVVRITDWNLEHVSDENHELDDDGNAWASSRIKGVRKRVGNPNAIVVLMHARWAIVGVCF